MAMVAMDSVFKMHTIRWRQVVAQVYEAQGGSGSAVEVRMLRRSELPGGREFFGQAVRIAATKAIKPVAPTGSSVPRIIVCQMVRQQNEQRIQEATVQETNVPSSLAKRWREIHGANNWRGLFDPMDPLLRKELIRIGDFAQSCYDGFDNMPHSKYFGSCRYCEGNFLECVGLPNTGYKVTKYLYATTDVKSLIVRNEHNEAWSSSSNWIGFVAVCTDEKKVKEMGRRDIVIAWRGTATKLEWAANLSSSLVPSALDERYSSEKGLLRIHVEEGFLSLYTTKNEGSRYNKMSAREQLLSELRRLIENYDDETLSITVTGHSLGGALALLTAYDIASSGINRHGTDVEIPTEWQQPTKATVTSDPSKTMEVGAIPVAAFTFAGPRVGNNPFVDKVQELGVKVLRVVNVKDIVPKVPGIFLNEDLPIFSKLLNKIPWTYSHCGVELELDHGLSPFLKEGGGLGNAHNLEAYLHLLAGYEGLGKSRKDFKLHVNRDIALVNKTSDFLIPQKYIPERWWQPQNKGLVLNEAGQYVQAERDPSDIPSMEYEALRIVNSFETVGNARCKM